MPALSRRWRMTSASGSLPAVATTCNAVSSGGMSSAMTGSVAPKRAPGAPSNVMCRRHRSRPGRAIRRNLRYLAREISTPSSRSSVGGNRGTRCGPVSLGRIAARARRSVIGHASPSANPGGDNRKEHKLSAPRPNGFREGTIHVRDLASVEIWERSLARSRQRRRLAEIGRRARRKRKSVSLALSAALATGPAIARGVAAADSGPGSTATNSTETLSDGRLAASGERIVLQTGSQGALVAAAQRRLNEVLPFTHLAVDGIFGPLTRGAVAQFQRSHGLTRTGAIEVLTWAILFKAPVLIMGGATGGGSAAAASGNGQTAAASSAASEGSTQLVATDAESSASEATVSQPSIAQPASAEASGSDSASRAPAPEASAASNATAGSDAPRSGPAAGAGSSVAGAEGSGTTAAPEGAEPPNAAGTTPGQPIAV